MWYDILMNPISKEHVEEIQKMINDFRSNGVTINVTKRKYDESFETIISIAFSTEYCALSISESIRSALVNPCDSGAGLGFRDLQLCCEYPGLVWVNIVMNMIPYGDWRPISSNREYEVAKDFKVGGKLPLY